MGILQKGQMIDALVIEITSDSVFINLNLKSEGIIDISEFTSENGNVNIHKGDVVKAYFVGFDNGENRFTTKPSLDIAYKEHLIVNGKVIEEIKGGYRISIENNFAFCPYSLMGSEKGKIGETLPFIIQNYEDAGRNIVVSNRKAIDEQRKKEINVLKEKLSAGMVVDSIVESIEKFGAFVNIEGMRALLPISQITYERIIDANSVLKVGQKLKVKIINIDWNHNRMSVSSKALVEDPWNGAEEKYKVSSKHRGKICRIQPFGLFVQLDSSIVGLVHISEIENINQSTNLNKMFSVGQEVSVVIKGINKSERRLSLSLSSSIEEDESASKYIDAQDSTDTYNPFASLLKK